MSIKPTLSSAPMVRALLDGPEPQALPLPPLPARRCIATIRAELRRWQATARRRAWAGTVDSVVGARIHALRLELWRDWRVMS